MIQIDTQFALRDSTCDTPPPPDSILRLRAVMIRTGLSRSSIYRAMHAGKFPQRYRLPPSGYAIGWSEREINSYVANLKIIQTEEPK